MAARRPIKRTRSTKAEVEARVWTLLDIIEEGRPMTVWQVSSKQQSEFPNGDRFGAITAVVGKFTYISEFVIE
jgi:hypothetical protein